MEHSMHLDIDNTPWEQGKDSYKAISGVTLRQDTPTLLNSTEGTTTISPLASHWEYDDQERPGLEDIVCSRRHSSLLPIPSLLSETFTVNKEQQALDHTLNPIDSTATSDRSRFPKRPPSALSIRSYSRHTPYHIPPPLSSCRSTTMDEEEDKKPTREELDEPMDPSTPTRGHHLHRRNHSFASDKLDPPVTPRSSGGTSVTSSPALASPSGSMSLSARRKKSAPDFPASPRQDLVRPVSASHLHLSHRQQIARSALISPTPRSAVPSSAPIRTPALLRVIASPTTPAFYKTGYNHPLRQKGSTSPVTFMRTPQSPYFHRGGLAPKTPISASAPARTPVRLVATAKCKGGVLPERAELDKVSKAWVVKSLQQNAPNVWYSPETTDCRVVVPVWSKIAARKKAREEAAQREAEAADVKPNMDESAIEVDSPTTDKTPIKRGTSSAAPGTADSLHSNQPGKTFWPPTPENVAQVNAAAEGMAEGKEDVVSSRTVKRGRRGSLPGDDTIPVIVFPLHKDYLITQSKLFRRLFSSTSSQLDLPVPAVNEAPGMSRTHSEGGPEAQSGDAKLKGSKVLPTPQGEPEAVYIPMPDPAAFGVIVQWLYWGDPKAVELALSKGIINWEGLVYNIDYLDLEDDIKRIVGKWWRKWVKTESSSGSRHAGTEFEEDDEEDERKGGGSGMEADEEDELKDDISDVEVKQEPMDDRFVDGFRRL